MSENSVEILLEFIEKNKAAVDSAANDIKRVNDVAKKYSNEQIQAAKQMQAAQAAAAKSAQDMAAKNAQAAKAGKISFTEISSAIGLVKQGLELVVGSAIKAYNAFQSYAGSVRDLAIASGTSADQASLLLQVLDDFEISSEDITAAMRAMKEKGLVPTIETLAQLADQFVAIKDPAERLQFAQENLGRSYSKYLNALSQGGDVLRESAGEVNKNLVLTDEQIAKAEEQRLAVDAVTDAWEGFKVQLGAVVGNMILANKNAQDLTDEFLKLHPEIRRSQIYTGAYDEQLDALEKQLAKGAAATEFYKNMTEQSTDALEENAEAVEEDKKAIEDLQRANTEEIDAILEATEAYRAYDTTQRDLAAKIDYLTKQKEKLIKQGWREESSKIKEINAELAKLNGEYDRNAEAFIDATKRKIAMMQLELIAMQDNVEGFSDAEQQKALAMLENLGLVEDYAIKSVMYIEMINKALLEHKLRFDQVNEVLNLLSQGYTIEVVIAMIADMARVPDSFKPKKPAGTSGGANNAMAYASGGQMEKGNFYLVGDAPGGKMTPWTELITPDGTILDAKTTKRMMESGMIDNIIPMAGGGSMAAQAAAQYAGMSAPTYTTSTAVQQKKRKAASGMTSATAGGDTSTAMAAAMDATFASQSQMEQNTMTQMQMQAAMQYAIQQTNDLLSQKLDEMIDVMTNINPRNVAAGIGSQFAKYS